MKKMRLLLLCLVACTIGAKAQIGYQISLLNTATGEPRANETVTVSVSLSNNANEIFYSETKSATTNDFGVLSLSIGNADTFKNVDLSKMPFFIEVTANGVMIGKSQMLSVPVAEVAKQLAPINKDLIVGTWNYSYYTDYYSSINRSSSLSFSPDGSGTYYYSRGDGEEKETSSRPFKYETISNLIIFYFFDVEDSGAEAIQKYAFLYNNQLWFDGYYRYQKQ